MARMILLISALNLIVAVPANSFGADGSDTRPASRPTDGIIIEQVMTVTSPQFQSPPQKMTMKIRGKRMRTDVGEMVSVLQFEDGRMVSLIHFNKTYTVTTVGQMKEGMERAAAARGKDDKAAPPPKPVPTGEKQKINGFDTTGYTFESAFMGQVSKVTVWVAADFPDAELIAERALAFQKAGPLRNVMGEFASQLHPEGLRGMVLRMETSSPGGPKSVVDVQSAKLATIEDAEFDLPKGYTEQKIPLPPKGVGGN